MSPLQQEVGKHHLRINIESKWFTDPRRFELAELVGGLEMSDGVMVAAWVLSQEFWSNGRLPVPVFKFSTLKHWQEILQVGLARTKNKTVYVCGSREHHEWIAKHKEGCKKGGQKGGGSNKLLKSKENESNTPSNTQATPEQLKSKSLPLPLTLPLSQSEKIQSCANPDENTQSGAEPSGSLDVLNQFDKNHESQEACNGFDLEAIYQAYPRRLGSQAKAQGMTRLKRLATTEEKYTAIMAGVEQYAQECLARKITGTEFVKSFGSFFGKHGPWREYAQGEVQLPSSAISSIKNNYNPETA